MACYCKKCGIVVPCDEEYCMNCYIDECLKDNASKNLMSGGRFYGERLTEGNKDG